MIPFVKGDVRKQVSLCHTCGPVTPSLNRGKATCPTCSRLLPTAPQTVKPAPVLAVLIDAVTLPPIETAAKVAPYVTANLAVQYLHRDTTGWPICLYLGDAPAWKLTPQIYARLRKAVEARIATTDYKRKLSCVDEQNLLDKLAIVEAALIDCPANAAVEIAEMPKPPALPLGM